MENNVLLPRRVDQWITKLSQDVYRPLAPIEWEGFVTDKQLGYDRAMSEGAFRPMPVGTKWGRDWEYMWVRSTITVPAEAEGEMLVLQLDAGGESSVYVNGAEFGTRRADWVRDSMHFMSDLVLCDSAVPGTTYELVLEVYAGHSSPGECRGPVFAEAEPVFTPGTGLRTEIRPSTFGVWNEVAFQLLVDVKALRSMRDSMPGNSLRKQDIIAALKQFTLTVDFEQDRAGRIRDYQKAREELAPVMACKNGSTAPQFYAFGHAHIDVAWLWPLAETERKVHRTFAAQLRHMDRYPEYKFLQSQPHLYRMTKKLYPALYERIREKIKSGQWIAEGGMWVEPDTNVSGGEALIRQLVHGKRFFKEEFDVDSRLLWLPDVFGYSAALPQIMKGCGIDYCSTQKIWWSYNGGDKFPYNDFIWQGTDGTKVRAFMHVDYNAYTDPATMVNRWEGRQQQYGLRGFLLPFGYGDGGGGPAREFIEYVLREKDCEGVPRVKMTNPNDYFIETPAPQDTYVGELYMQCHRGVQTSQAKVKWGNRKCELGLREVEALGVLAAEKGYVFPLAEMDEHWKQVLLCQFHDILPGSSIAKVYEDAHAAHAGVLNALADIRVDMAAALTNGENALTVFNSLSFDRVVLATLPEGWEGAAACGEALSVQELDGRLVAQVTVPAMGSVVLTPAAAKAGESRVTARITADGAVMQNGRLTLTFNRRGEITSAKTAKGELLRGKGNELKMFKDTAVTFEAWDIDETYELLPVELPDEAEIEVVSEGALAASLRITRRVHNSDLTQIVTMRADTDRVDFDTTVDWQESHKLLKVGFDVDVHAEEAVHEIQFGYIKRPNHRSRPYDADRYEVPNHRWTALVEGGRGAAVLNDCKYGVNVLDSSINLTLLRATRAPDDKADIGTQHFVYSFYPFEGSLAESDLQREAYDLNCPATEFGGAWQRDSAVTLSGKTVFIDTMKPAEDGSGDVVLRLYEAMGCHTNTELALNLPFGKVLATDMLEENGEEVTVTNNTVSLSFRPFEIKTLRLTAQ